MGQNVKVIGGGYKYCFIFISNMGNKHSCDLNQLRIDELIILLFILISLVILSTLFNIFGNKCSCEKKVDKLITDLEARNSMVIQNVNNENTRLLRALESIATYIVTN